MSTDFMFVLLSQRMVQSERNLLPKSNVAGFYAEGDGFKVY
ncbi:MAG: hypothetical protein P8J27_01290 [Mariniblastus sp.]|nr:hypothetical protein [Mariniblastus sp.]